MKQYELKLKEREKYIQDIEREYDNKFYDLQLQQDKLNNEKKQFEEYENDMNKEFEVYINNFRDKNMKYNIFNYL